MFARITTFLKEARIELKKVSWPTRQSTIHYTIAVVAMSIATAAVLGGLDVLFAYLLRHLVF